MEGLAASYSGFALAHGVDRAGAGSRRRFTFALKQFFEHDRVVEASVLGRKQQGKLFLLISEIVESVQRFLRFRLSEFFEILLAESFPFARPRVIPTAQFIGGCQVA